MSKFCWIWLLILITVSGCKKDDPVILPPWYPEVSENGDPVLGVFENKLPCEDCERIKFAIVLYGNTQTNEPSSYMMGRVYVGKGNDQLTNTGEVIITKGTSVDSLHTVYNLSTGAPEEFQHFWKIDENLLFILDENLTPMVGNAAYGYVLNRTR